MERDVIIALAQAAGLEQALEAFPKDVADAVEQARGYTAGIEFPSEPGAEPWPPMRPGVGL